MATAALVTMAAPAIAAPPPASAFGRIPVVVDAAISPDGTRVAILGGLGDQRTLSIATLDNPTMPSLALGDIEAVSVRWAGDRHVLARVAYWEEIAPRVAYRFERNISITAEGKPVGRLLEREAASQFLIRQPVLGVTSDAQAMVLGLAVNSGANAGMDTRIKRKGEGGFITALWKVDPGTGKGQLIEKGTNDTDRWEVDRAGQSRVRLDIDEINHRFSVFGRPEGKGSWKLAWSGGDFESRRAYYGYSEPDDAIYLNLDGKLVKRRLADGVTSPLGQGAAGPSARLVWDEHRNVAVGIGSGAERTSYEWLDPEIAAAGGVLTRALRTQELTFHGWSRDRTRFLVRAASPNSPGVWYLYDRPRKEISPLAEEYPELKGAALGTTRWMTYKARDGLEIPAYLTLPPGAQPGVTLPLIVYPHGGPKSRDDFDFDFIAQFLATRGYAVLQPQFRGSWGFGPDFENAGKGEWGGKMQTDLIDGIAALAATGVVDPKRVCAVGASFGGYAAMAGVSLNPGTYKCAASIAGVSDLGLFVVETGRVYGRDAAGLDELRGELGAASTEKLNAHSPARHAAAVNVPLLLIHGDEDTVVPLEQSVRMADQLKAAGKSSELIILKGENHYLSRAAARTQTLEALETFLARNLPAS